MIAKEYHKILESQLNRRTYLLVPLVVASLQLLKQVKLEVLAEYNSVVLGEREFCSPKRGNWLREKGVSFCLRLKCDTKIRQEAGFYQELRDSELSPGMKLFLNEKQVTQQKGFGSFNVACKWKRTYRGFKTNEPWYILTNLSSVEAAIEAYQKRFEIEEMFRDSKSGGYSLEGSKLSGESLSQLMILVAIAYTSATLQGKSDIENNRHMGIPGLRHGVNFPLDIFVFN